MLAEVAPPGVSAAAADASSPPEMPDAWKGTKACQGRRGVETGRWGMGVVVTGEVKGVGDNGNRKAQAYGKNAVIVRR